MCTHEDTILSVGTIAKLIGDKCDGVIGQLTERWDDELFGQLKGAGGRAYSNYAVGYNNVTVPDASKHGLPVGNTPGAPRSACASTALAHSRRAGPRIRASPGRGATG